LHAEIPGVVSAGNGARRQVEAHRECAVKIAGDAAIGYEFTSLTEKVKEASR
jgi:hypothetical protein